ncbi:MAG TPA: LOG family protein [bacterium]|nr:LOG family protein [bacterium]
MKKNNEFNDLKKSFLEYKKKAGNINYIACFGKTFLDKDSQEYKLAKDVSELIIKNGFGVIHGGYTGIMEASSLGADRAIKKDKEKNKYWNIGVPMIVFDKELERSSEINLPPAKDISDRKKALIEFCDICVVLPSGGFGTILEALEIFHTNQLAEKFGGKIRPLVFIGGNWKKIFNSLYRNLDMNKQKNGESFVYFIKSLKELDGILSILRKKDE